MAGGPEGGDDLVAVGGVHALDGEVDLGGAGADVGEEALVQRPR